VTESSPVSNRFALLTLKRSIVKEYGWTLHDIDETDINNLMAFIQFNPKENPDIRIKNGKTYKRAKKAPSWL